MSDKQILIVGTGRSGTSILKKILNFHSEIYAYPKELRFIADRNGIMDLRTSLTTGWNPHNASSTIHGFVDLMTKQLFASKFHEKALNRFFKYVLSGSVKKYTSVRMGDFIPRDYIIECINTLFEAVGIKLIPGYWYGSESYQLNPEMYYSQPVDKKVFDNQAGKFIDNLLSYPLSANNKMCWCDDTPMNILYTDVLSQMLSNIRIIHIYRNPLDVVASYVDSKQSWAPANPAYAAQWVKEILTSWVTLRNDIARENYLEVKYEYLISNQEEGLNKIMDFIGLEFEETLLQIKLNSRSVGRYISDIPKQEISQVVSTLHPILKEFDYKI